MSWIERRVEDGVTRLILNRPEALNALNEEMAAQFAAAVRLTAQDPTRVVVLSGRGAAFCAGGDLDFISANQRRSVGQLAPLMRRFYAAFLSLRTLPQATIAQIHGAAVGAGLCLALACDLRVAADDARCSFNFVRLGLSPGMAAWPLARAAFGDARARELLLTGREFSGRQMREWGGAVDGAASGAPLEAVTRTLAENISKCSRAALLALKKEMCLGDDLDGYLRAEAAAQARTFTGPDLVEGLAALRERRPPNFNRPVGRREKSRRSRPTS